MRSKTEVAPDAEAIDRFCSEPYEVPGSKGLNIVAMRGGWSATTLIDADGRLYEVSFSGIQGPSEDFENVVVRDIAPGFKHNVVICEGRKGHILKDSYLCFFFSYYPKLFILLVYPQSGK